MECIKGRNGGRGRNGLQSKMNYRGKLIIEKEWIAE